MKKISFCYLLAVLSTSLLFSCNKGDSVDSDNDNDNEDEYVGDITSGKAVNLGLSVKWAGWNVGASSPEEYGGYYAWGETEEKSNFKEYTYKYYKNNKYIDIGDNISGTRYDVAHVKWGGSWRMPTYAEQQELWESCSWKWTTRKGIYGMKVTGPNGNSIFLPAAGDRNGTVVYGRSEYGHYWSGSFNVVNRAYYLYFVTDGSHWHANYYNRFIGLSVRPVTK